MNKFLRQSQLFVKRNAPTILTCVGGVGVVVTTVSAVKATPKALALLDEAKKEKGEDLTKLEVIKTAAPAYIPTIISGATTLACVFGANILNKRQQASLISAYAFLDNTNKEYKNKVKELYGEEGEMEVKKSIAQDKLEESDILEEDDKELFFDEFSGRYFNSTLKDVIAAQYELNREISMLGYARLNDYYAFLGIDPIEEGDILGWSEGGNLDRYWQAWIDFNNSKTVLEDGLECYIVTMFSEPTTDFEYY